MPDDVLAARLTPSPKSRLLTLIGMLHLALAFLYGPGSTPSQSRAFDWLAFGLSSRWLALMWLGAGVTAIACSRRSGRAAHRIGWAAASYPLAVWAGAWGVSIIIDLTIDGEAWSWTPVALAAVYGSWAAAVLQFAAIPDPCTEHAARECLR